MGGEQRSQDHQWIGTTHQHSVGFVLYRIQPKFSLDSFSLENQKKTRKSSRLKVGEGAAHQAVDVIPQVFRIVDVGIRHGSRVEDGNLDQTIHGKMEKSLEDDTLSLEPCLQIRKKRSVFLIIYLEKIG